MFSRAAFETVISTVIAAAAVVIAATTVLSALRPPRADREVARAAPTYVEDWRDLLALGTPMGHAEATVSIIEFADFECPACRQFEVALQSLPDSLASKVRLTLVHFPLPYHRFAIPSALAFECAAAQDRAVAMRQVLFMRQDSLGLLPWSQMAARAGVSDIVSFDTCVASRAYMARVDSGAAASERLGLRGTPTLFIDGWRFDHVPAGSELGAIVAA
jgi:protein-disulfide isomerase